MNWQIILKRRLTSKYLHQLKAALLDVVRRLPSGTKFRTIELKEDFLKELKNYISSQMVGNFKKMNIDNWLNSTGGRLINNSGLVVEGREKEHYKVRK